MLNRCRSTYRKLRTAVAVLLLATTLRAAEPKEILLWPNGAPGSEGKAGDAKVRIADNGEHVISNIHKPSITPYLPSADKATGRAVIVAPGGGHRELWSDHEGHHVARWLSEHGIAAFVLKYRLAHETNSTYTVDDHALADMQRALRLVRSRSIEWGIATNRIGLKTSQPCPNPSPTSSFTSCSARRAADNSCATKNAADSMPTSPASSRTTTRNQFRGRPRSHPVRAIQEPRAREDCRAG